MDIVNKFLSFDKLIGETLVKFVYFVGLAVIAIMTLLGMFSGFSNGFFSGLVSIIFAPIGGALGVLYWRFVCEMFIVIFKIGNDLSDVRDALAGGAAPTSPPPAAEPPPAYVPPSADPEDGG